MFIWKKYTTTILCKQVRRRRCHLRRERELRRRPRRLQRRRLLLRGASRSVRVGRRSA